MNLSLLIGGVRSGKSAKAVALAECLSVESHSSDVLFCATARAFDDEMRRRIAVHQSERQSGWRTLEEPLLLAERLHDALSGVHQEAGVVVIDCITLWVSNLLLANEEQPDIEQYVDARTAELVRTMHAHAFVPGDEERAREWIVVTNEVGLGVVPPTALGRQYRDALGRANQTLARAATNVTLTVAGLELRMK